MTDAVADSVRLDMTGVKETVGVLSDAFQDDPVFTYFIPDPERRKRKSHHIFKSLVRYSVAYGEVYSTSKNFEAVTVWLPHDKVEMNLRNALKNGGISIITRINPASVLRQLATTDLMCATHKELAPYPHQYLYLVGVKSEFARMGHAGVLMRCMLARLDNEGVPCYLDNTNENNLPIYEHYGFKTVKEYTIPKTQVRIWAMVRQPAKT